MALLKGHGTTNEVYYYQLDHLGTPQELTDAGGKIVWSAHYRAYGNVIKFDINEISNPLRFQGQYYDEESGLHYNRHRYYNPNTGRYLTPDPIKLAGGLNSYQYVPNPTGWVDPLGLMSVEGECPGGEETAHPTNGERKVLWGSWQDYPKISEGSKTYAQVGERLYTEHAVNRMQPSGMGSPAGEKVPGRNVSPTFIDGIIRSAQAINTTTNGVPRAVYWGGNVGVVTERSGKLVITILRRSSK